MNRDLDERGSSTELNFLLARHPRSKWPKRHSPTVEFWLGVHERLRRDCAGVRAAAEDHEAGRYQATQLAVVAAPRVNGLVAAMQGHHQIEDFQYFPAFRRAEPKLARGFDLLEREHGELRAEIDSALRGLAELRAAAHAGATTTLALAAKAYRDAAELLCARLLRHLDHEEDLVVPLLLEHGEL